MQLPGSRSRALRSRQPRARRRDLQGREERRREREGKREEGGEARSLAPPSLGPVPRRGRTARPGCGPATAGTEGNGLRPGPRGGSGRWGRPRSHPRPPHSPAQPAPPRDARRPRGTGWSRPSRERAAPGAGACPRAGRGVLPDGGQRRLPWLSRDGNSLLRCSSFPSLTKPVRNHCLKRWERAGSSKAPRACRRAREVLGAAPNPAGRGHGGSPSAPRPRFPLEIFLWLFLVLKWF